MIGAVRHVFMQSKALVRAATPDDIAFMMRVERECATAAHWAERQYRELFVPEAIAQRLALVAEESREHASGRANSPLPRGFLIARHLAPEWELENIVVAPDARRMGIGRQLLEALLAAARETRSQAVTLEVRESNTPARALYDNFEFKPVGRRKSYYLNPVEDAILYSRTLG